MNTETQIVEVDSTNVDKEGFFCIGISELFN